MDWAMQRGNGTPSVGVEAAGVPCRRGRGRRRAGRTAAACSPAPSDRLAARAFRSLRRVALLAALLSLAAALVPQPAGAAADPNKVLREAFAAGETGFDPAAVHDLYSLTLVQAIFETLYTYDYLARPARIVPLTARALPVVEDGGRVWTIALRPGIRFAADPAFGGRPRELTAADYAYSLKRLADPAIRSPWAFLVAGKFAGLDELAAAARRSGR